MNIVALLRDVSTMSTTDYVGNNQARRNSMLVVALAVLSFVIYAYTVFTLPQVRNSLACCKVSGIAAGLNR